MRLGNMIITICSSVDFTPKIKEITETLRAVGHTVHIPHYSQKIIDGEVTLEDYLKQKNKNGDAQMRAAADHDLIKRHYNLIQNSNAILVVNCDKKGIKNYIGGNTFLEMGFAYVLNKKIFILNPIPDIVMINDELKNINPVVLNNDLTLIL